MEYGMNIQAIEVDEDHVHVYIEIPPQRSVGSAVGILKSVSARMMFKRFSYLKRKLWAGEFWGGLLLCAHSGRWSDCGYGKKIYF